jgi:hypothetical protein
MWFLVVWICSLKWLEICEAKVEGKMKLKILEEVRWGGMKVNGRFQEMWNCV